MQLIQSTHSFFSLNAREILIQRTQGNFFFFKCMCNFVIICFSLMYNYIIEATQYHSRQGWTTNRVQIYEEKKHQKVNCKVLVKECGIFFTLSSVHECQTILNSKGLFFFLNIKWDEYACMCCKCGEHCSRMLTHTEGVYWFKELIIMMPWTASTVLKFTHATLRWTRKCL